MSAHWMVFVNWQTIVGWKDRRRDERESGHGYPFQYSSDSRRFLEIAPGDVIWIVTTPRFGRRGQPTLRGRARPPAVMGRLRVARLCCNGVVDGMRGTPVCTGRLPDCAAPGVLPEGVNASSDAWSVVAIGERDPQDPDPMHTTYPALYNMFGVLRDLAFETEAGTTGLRDYLDWVEAGQYLSPAQQRARAAGRRVVDPGPYSAFGRRFQSPRKLTQAAARAMDAFHGRAVAGRTVFFSYRWCDVEAIARAQGRDRKAWIAELNSCLAAAGFNNWLDHHQIFAADATIGLLEEILKDAVQQSVIFVALSSPTYGTTRWTRAEWEHAQTRAADPRFRSRMRRLVLDAGGDPARLGGDAVETIAVGPQPAPRAVAEAIRRACADA